MTYQRWLWSSVVAVSTVVALSAQTPKPTFEVASIKKRTEPFRLTSWSNPNVMRGNLFSMPNVTVESLIKFAYDLTDYQMTGGPDWIRRDRFEVQARSAVEASTEQMRLMVQSLLEERFKLVIRMEPREMSHLALLLAHSDGRLGPNLRRRDCKNGEISPMRPPPPSGSLSTSGCGTMSSLAAVASRWMRAPVIDRTGLDGTFDHYMLVSSPDAPTADIPGLAGLPTQPPAGASLPSYRDGLREQLGLRLESARGPIEVLVIDSVQQPTEN